MAIADFTSPDDIRAALGVSSTEIKDAVISLPLYENSLALELDQVNGGLAAAAAAASAKPPEGRTQFERVLIISVNLFATYAVARHLGGTLPMFSPKEISDGKATLVRFSQDPYKATIAAVEAKYNEYRASVIQALANVSGVGAATAGLRPYMSVVSPGSDPVTGT